MRSEALFTMNRMGSEEFVVMDTQWEEIKTKPIRDSKILKKIQLSSIRNNDCLAPEGDQKDKRNELKLQDFDAGHRLWFKFYVNTAFHHPQGVAHVFTIKAFFPHELDLLLSWKIKKKLWMIITFSAIHTELNVPTSFFPLRNKVSFSFPHF